METVTHYLGHAAWILLLIPLVLLVRLFVKRSRWSVLRICLVSITGTLITAVWLTYAEAIVVPDDVYEGWGGIYGRWISLWLISRTDTLTAYIISEAAFFLWIVFAVMDAVIATARFYINKPYIKEIRKEIIVEKIKWTEKEKPVKPTTTAAKKPAKTPSQSPTTSPIPEISSIDEAPEYKMPPVSVLEDRSSSHHTVTKGEIDRNISIIKETLADHHVKVSDIQAIPGPTVTLYKIYPAKGVKVSAVRSLTDDVSVALKAGKVIASLLEDCVGMEVANKQRSAVSMRELVESSEFKGSGASLPVVIGRKVTGDIKVFDLADAPHLLVAGATGQGKSVGLNVLIASLLYAKRPSELKLVFIDPKKTEFSKYSRLISHYLAVRPGAQSQDDERAHAIIKDPKTADTILRSLCQEMDDRYTLLEAAGTPEIKEYNAKYIAHKLNPKDGHRFLPYVVTIIDEYSQLLLGTGGPEGKAHARSIMTSLISIAQMGRAAGLHLVIATQTPRREVVSGLIKANFPMSIAFTVKTDVDSRVILDEAGAEKLLGKGDMLITKNADTDRVQCGYISTDEIDALTRKVESQKGYKKSFNTPYYLPEVEEESGSAGDGAVDMKKLDDKFEEAARLVVMSQRGSTSDLQRKMSIGYAKAGRIMDQLEAAGIVGSQNGSQKREVLVGSLDELEEILKAYKN